MFKDIVPLLFFFSMLNDSGVGNMSSLPVASPSAGAGMRKNWHEDITQDLRNHLVHKLYALFHNYSS